MTKCRVNRIEFYFQILFSQILRVALPRVGSDCVKSVAFVLTPTATIPIYYLPTYKDRYLTTGCHEHVNLSRKRVIRHSRPSSGAGRGQFGTHVTCHPV